MTNLRGKAILPDSCAQRDFNYILVPHNPDFENQYGSGIIDSGGSFSINHVLVDNYNVFIKPKGLLQKKFSGIDVQECQNRIDFGPFIHGDLDDDNTVDVDDFGIFSGAYGTTMSDLEYNALSDFNCNGEIDVDDFSVFSEAFGKTGDEP